MSQPGKSSTDSLSCSLKPICCRHNHPMSFEENEIRWKKGEETQTLHCYHCSDPGCSVRYTPAEGYFTVIDTPVAAHFVEEPGVNLFQCPRHGTWMYRCKMDGGKKFEWRCGTDDCYFSTAQPLPMTATS